MRDEAHEWVRQGNDCFFSCAICGKKGETHHHFEAVEGACHREQCTLCGAKQRFVHAYVPAAGQCGWVCEACGETSAEEPYQDHAPDESGRCTRCGVPCRTASYFTPEERRLLLCLHEVVLEALGEGKAQERVVLEGNVRHLTSSPPMGMSDVVAFTMLQFFMGLKLEKPGRYQEGLSLYGARYPSGDAALVAGQLTEKYTKLVSEMYLRNLTE